VERFNGTLKPKIGAVCDSTGREWDSVLPSFTSTYNSKRHSTTERKPKDIILLRPLSPPSVIETDHKEKWILNTILELEDVKHTLEKNQKAYVS
jgi:hypothetical protein